MGVLSWGWKGKGADKNKQGAFYGAFLRSRRCVFSQTTWLLQGQKQDSRASRLHKEGGRAALPTNTGSRSALRGSVPLNIQLLHGLGKAKAGQAASVTWQMLSYRTGRPTACPGQRPSPELCFPLSFSVHSHARAVWSLPLHGRGLPEWHPGKALPTPQSPGVSSLRLLPYYQNPKCLLPQFSGRIRVIKILPYTVCQVKSLCQALHRCSVMRSV